MKQFNTLLLLMILMGTLSLSAQSARYRSDVFTSFTVQKNVVYGSNITVLRAPTIAPENLLMDIYQPAGDTVKKRPVIIYFHTGSFLPPLLNGGITGARSDSSCVEFARRLTRLGYVVCITSYRLGWNPISPDQNERTGTLLNAAYRGIQDSRTAIRFLRKSVAEQSNPYGIDPSKIVLWGQGTGGYISLGTAYLDRFKEEIEIEKFINTATLTAFVDTNLLSNPFGTTAKPLNLINHAGYSTNFNMAVNMGGALGDIGWIEGKAGEPSTIGFHVLTDPFAPFADGAVIVPTTRQFVVNVSGTRSVVQRANEVGLNARITPAGNEATYINLRNKAYSAVPIPFPTFSYKGAATTLSTDNMYPFVMPSTPGRQFQAGPWEWWDTTTLKIVVAGTNMALGTSYDWKKLHSDGLLTNPDMSKARAMTYIDTIMSVFVPRAFLELNLATSTQEVISADVVKLKIGPNPVSDRVYLQSALEYKMRDIVLYNIEGKMIRGYANVDENDFELQRGNIPPGTYVLQIRFDKGVVAKKLIFN